MSSWPKGAASPIFSVPLHGAFGKRCLSADKTGALTEKVGMFELVYYAFCSKTTGVTEENMSPKIIAYGPEFTAMETGRGSMHVKWA